MQVIDDFGPLPLEQPQSVADVCILVRSAAAAGEALYPLGGGTKLSQGLPPTRRGRCVQLTALTQVIDYPARDMTITVQAGVRIAELQQLLASEQQRLPIDVPGAASATLGGILATNTSGGRRLGLGTLRDYVIGITVVNDRGAEARAGGRVVKNVAGYDLCKLHIGALGTLGIISQVTLKVRPLPEEQALLLLRCEAAQLDAILDLLHSSRTRPVCVDVLNPAAAAHLGLATPQWLVVVGYECTRAAVSWQVQQLVCEVKMAYPLEAHVGPTAAALWQQLVELPGWTGGGVTYKASMPARSCAAFCRAAMQLPGRPLLQAHAGNGIVLGHLAADATLADAQQHIQALRTELSQTHGHLVLLRCPSAWKQTLSVWGPPTDAAWLMRQVKQQLDPQRLFNPGRFVDGI